MSRIYNRCLKALYLGVLVILTFATDLIFANFAYVVNARDTTVSVIDTSTNNVIATITVGSAPIEVAITPNGEFAYVTNSGATPGTVSVIDTSTNHVVATVSVGNSPFGIAITPNGKFAYVANTPFLGSVSVIDTSTNTVIATVPVGNSPLGLAITPDGKFAYVADQFAFSVINTSTNTATNFPISGRGNEIAFTPDGRFAYITTSPRVLVIDTSTNMVTATITAGREPFGIAITPTPLPPKNLTGRQKKNDFGVVYELFNKLEWQANTSSPTIAGYIVFRNGVKIATLSAFTLEFEDHDIKKHTSNTYSIVSFATGGVQSMPVTVTIR